MISWLRKSNVGGSTIPDQKTATADGERLLAAGNAAAALDVLLPLAKSGNAIAQRHIGEVLLAGIGSDGARQAPLIEADPPTAIKWLTAAASAGDPIAQCRLAELHFKGEHLPQSDTEAEAWYRRAATLGLAEAQDMLSWLLAESDGRAPDYAESRRWAEAAAAQGLAASMTRLGLFHHNALGVPRDSEAAVTWWRRAALLGEADAQAMLGAAHHIGQGVSRDAILAYAWLRRARRGGSKLAERFIYAVRASLTADEIAAAEARAELPLEEEARRP